MTEQESFRNDLENYIINNASIDIKTKVQNLRTKIHLEKMYDIIEDPNTKTFEILPSTILPDTLETVPKEVKDFITSSYLNVLKIRSDINKVLDK